MLRLFTPSQQGKQGNEKHEHLERDKGQVAEEGFLVVYKKCCPFIEQVRQCCLGNRDTKIQGIGCRIIQPYSNRSKQFCQYDDV